MSSDKLTTNIDYWDQVVKNQPPSYQRWFANEREYLQKIVTPNARVLDVGCGSGRSIFDILPITQNVVGVDHEESAVNEARAKFAGYPSVKILNADATSLPFSDAEFDFVICMGSFANFADKKHIILQEMRRVLKPTGKIIISVFSEDALEERMKLYKTLGDIVKEVRGTTVIFHESLGDNISEQFNESQLREIFAQNNLQVENIVKAEIAYLCTISKI